jgi:outer membrane protein
MKKTRERLCVFACGLALALATGAAAHAQEQDYQPHAGTIALSVDGAGVFFNSSAKFTLAGHPVPGANLTISNTATATFEAEFYVRKDLSLSLNVGVPPTISAKGAGILTPVGNLGSVQFGPGAGYLNYHFGGLGRVQPFVGAGVSRMLIFADHDGAITRLNVHPAWGAAVRGGVTYMLTPRWGVNANVSHLFLSTHAGGVFNGLEVGAKAVLDPTIIHGGVTMRF